MSLFESGESNGTVSIGDLFDGKTLSLQENSLDIDDLAFLTCRGGWPWATLLQKEIALDQALDNFDSVTSSDIQRVDNTKRSQERTKLLMRSYARNISQQVPFTTIRKDMLSNDSQTLDEDTVADYVNALKKLFVIEDLPAWSRSNRLGQRPAIFRSIL